MLRIGPSASLTLLKPGPTTRNARPREKRLARRYRHPTVAVVVQAYYEEIGPAAPSLR